MTHYKGVGSHGLSPKRGAGALPFLLTDGLSLLRRVEQGRTGAKIKLLLHATVCLSAITVATPHADAQSGPFLYVPSAGDNTVSVIDTPTNSTVPPPIVTDVQPVVAAVRGDQSFVYVTNQASNTVSVINTATNAVVATVNVGSSPAGAAVTPNGATVYIANMADGTVSVINTATNAVSGTIPVGSGAGVVAVTPDGSRVYVGNNNGNTVTVIDTATNTVLGGPVLVGNSPLGLSVTPDGTRVYVANNASDTVSVINTATNTVVATFGVGSQPFGVAVSPDGTRAYVTNSASNTVSVVDTATNTVVTTFAAGNSPFGVSFSPDGKQAYVANQNGSDVTVIDTTSNTVIGTIPVGQVPIFPGICSNGNASARHRSHVHGANFRCVSLHTRFRPDGLTRPGIHRRNTAICGSEHHQRSADYLASRWRHLRHQRQRCHSLGIDQRGWGAHQNRRRNPEARGGKHLRRRDRGERRHLASRCRERLLTV